MNHNTTIKITDPTFMAGFIQSIGTEARFISFTSDTEVKMRKTGKVARRNGLVNVDYVAACNRGLAELGVKKPDYVPGKTWYKHTETADGKTLPLCVGNTKKTQGKFYLQYFPYRNLGTKYVLNGKELTADEVEKLKTFIAEKDDSDFKPMVITVGLANIKEIKFRKVSFQNDRTPSFFNRFKNTVIEVAPATPAPVLV
jgi:hypothetical protein